MPIRCILGCFLFAFISPALYGQRSTTPEFSKGALFIGQVNSGLSTQFTQNTPDFFMVGLGLNPQVTVVEGQLRLGLQGDLEYVHKKMVALAGPMLALRLANFRLAQFGTIGNIQLTGTHRWGSRGQRLAGGGLVVELGKTLQIGLQAQRDYRANTWWLQTTVGIQWNKSRREKPIFD